MSYKVYMTKHLAGLGPAIVIVGPPIPSNREHITECHAFFSKSPDSYGFFTTSYRDDDRSIIDEAEVRESAKSYALDYLHNYLSESDPVKYKVMISDIQYQLNEVEPNDLLRLHLQNLLSSKIEKSVTDKALDPELREFTANMSRTGRVTTEWKT